MHSSALMKSVWASRPVSPQELHHLKQNKFKYFFLFAKVETQRFNCTRPEMWLYGTFVCLRIKVGSYVKIIHWISDGWSSSAYQTLKPHLPSALCRQSWGVQYQAYILSLSGFTDPGLWQIAKHHPGSFSYWKAWNHRNIKGNLEHKKENAKWNRWPEFKLKKQNKKPNWHALYN